MKIEDIEQKLADFYEGKTSAADEKAIYAYFLTAESLSEKLERERKLYLRLYEEKDEIEVPAHLENKLDSLIDSLAEEEMQTPQRRTLNWKWTAGIAASFLVLIASLIFMMPKDGEQSLLVQQDESEQLVDTYSDPKEAYVATQNALLLASAKLNKAFQQVESAQENIEKLNK